MCYFRVNEGVQENSDELRRLLVVNRHHRDEVIDEIMLDGKKYDPVILNEIK